MSQNQRRLRARPPINASGYIYRTEKSRTVEGSGLGLSLVAAVVSLHGFRLRIGGSEAGCVVEIACFPAAMPDPAHQQCAPESQPAPAG